MLRCTISLGILVILATSSGCQNDSTSGVSLRPPADDVLCQKIDHALDFTYENRRLNLQDHAAWQILHGALTYQRSFMVRDGDKLVSAVDHVLAGGYMNGWTMQPGDLLDEETGRRGLRAVVESGTKTGQGHTDQWLAIIAQCGLPPEQTIVVDTETYAVRDWVEQVLWDVPKNTHREYSWTLIGLTTYLPTDYQWTASDGRQWSIEKLVEIEVEQDLASSACGGTHRLIGISMALNRHIAAGGEVEGAWKRAEDKINDAIEKARELQNPDGSLSTNYFARPGRSPDLAKGLGTTGHAVEFLTLAMTREQLEQDWIKRAVNNLAELFANTEDLALECGALYHAAHGLALYRERMYGPRPYPRDEAKDAATAAAPLAGKAG